MNNEICHRVPPNRLGLRGRNALNYRPRAFTKGHFVKY